MNGEANNAMEAPDGGTEEVLRRHHYSSHSASA
jgi:hypothetical protein